MAGLQAPGPDGIRRTRAVIVRNTGNQLTDTTLSSWFYWFKPGRPARGKRPRRISPALRRRRVRGPVPAARHAAGHRARAVARSDVRDHRRVRRNSAGDHRRSVRPLRPLPISDHGRLHQLGHVGLRRTRRPKTIGGSTTSTTKDRHSARPGRRQRPRNIRYFLQPPGLLDDGTGNPDARKCREPTGQDRLLRQSGQGQIRRVDQPVPARAMGLQHRRQARCVHVPLEPASVQDTTSIQRPDASCGRV
jgi:hypothetical protein